MTVQVILLLLLHHMGIAAEMAKTQALGATLNPRPHPHTAISRDPSVTGDGHEQQYVPCISHVTLNFFAKSLIF